MTELLQVQTVTPTRDDAVALARSAVEAQLAAGAQITGPVTSAFWHLGEFGTGEEWQVILKTTANAYPALEQHLVEHHVWTNPEVSALPLARASAPYAEWVDRVTGKQLSDAG